MPSPTESQLAMLSPQTKPDCDRLLNDIKDSLNRASAINLWNRLQHNHFTRYVWWPGSALDDWSTRKIPQPGQKPPLPWPNSANLKIRLTDEVVNRWRDYLTVAESRTPVSIVPSDLDMGNDDRMQKAAGWGTVYDYFAEQADLELHRARASWKDIAQEYGHAIIYVGWKVEKQLEKRTLDAETVVQLIAWLQMQQAQQQGMPITQDTQAMAEGLAALTVFDEDNTALIAALQQIDPEMSAKEARRIAPQIRKGKPVDYGVPVVVNMRPDVRALIPGLHVFYPPETVDIQQAQFIVTPEWVSDVQMREYVTTRGWSKEAVEAIIEHAQPGRATFFDNISFGTYMAQPINWALTGGMIGLGVQAWDPAGEKYCRQWQLLTVRYRATDPDTGVPVMYETSFHPDCVNNEKVTEQYVFHGWSINDHAQYPFADYKREEYAPSLWDSRGVGELSYSEQAELKEMADFAYNNAQITLRPPYEISTRSELASKDLAPGAKIVTSSNFGQGIKTINIGGDPTPAVEVANGAMSRARNYWQIGQDPGMDPLEKQIAAQARVDDYMKCAKRAARLIFATIQQYCPDEVKAGAVNGDPAQINLTKHDIQGSFSVKMDFDVGDLDPKSIESRAKMMREFISPLDNQGLIQIAPLLKVMMQTLFPKSGKLLVASGDEARQQQIDLAKTNLMKALSGIEPDYVSGGNPKLRAQVIQSILDMPAIDDKGQPIPDPQTGGPMPGRARMIALNDPTAGTLVQNLLKHEQFESEQQDNVEIGRKGVKELQPVDQS
jgi:hypothetical protein